MEKRDTITIKIPEKTTGEKACDWLRTVRIALHARILVFEDYKSVNAASKRYISLTITALERSRMFMGKLMGAYGSKSPYPDGYKPENTKVEDISDTYSGLLPTIASGQEIVFIKQQRKEVKSIIEGLESFMNHFPFNSKGNLFLNEVIISLHDVTNWLGMELWSIDQDIKKSPKDDIATITPEKKETEKKDPEVISEKKDSGISSLL